MKSLEEVFTDYFDYPAPFDNNGELTEQGVLAYTKLLSLIQDLQSLGIVTETERTEDRIDEIIDGAVY